MCVAAATWGFPVFVGNTKVHDNRWPMGDFFWKAYPAFTVLQWKNKWTYDQNIEKLACLFWQTCICVMCWWFVSLLAISIFKHSPVDFADIRTVQNLCGSYCTIPSRRTSIATNLSGQCEFVSVFLFQLWWLWNKGSFLSKYGSKVLSLSEMFGVSDNSHWLPQARLFFWDLNILQGKSAWVYNLPIALLATAQ